MIWSNQPPPWLWALALPFPRQPRISGSRIRRKSSLATQPQSHSNTATVIGCHTDTLSHCHSNTDTQPLQIHTGTEQHSHRVAQAQSNTRTQQALISSPAPWSLSRWPKMRCHHLQSYLKAIRSCEIYHTQLKPKFRITSLINWHQSTSSIWQIMACVLVSHLMS